MLSPLSAALVASLGVFALSAASPNNPLSETIDGWEFISPESKTNLEAAYGNTGWFGAWASWVGTVVTSGDLGYSRLLKLPVVDILATRGLNTLAAGLFAVVLTLVVTGIAVLIFSVKPRLAESRLVAGAIGTWLTIPSFLLGVLVVLYFGAYLPNPATTAPIAQIPAVSLVIAVAWVAPMIANVRSAAVEQAGSSWGLALIGRGVSPWVRIKAMAPGLMAAAFAYGFVLVPQIVLGEAVVEAILSYPGLGNATVMAAVGADLPLLATVTAIAAFTAAAVWAWRPAKRAE